MRTSIFIAALIAVLLALPVTIGWAQPNAYAVVRAYVVSGSTSLGTALITRQLTTEQTHVMVHVKNLTAGSNVTWKIESGSYCGTPSTATQLTSPAPIRITSAGIALSSTYLPGTLTVTTGTSMMTFRIYDATNA